MATNKRKAAASGAALPDTPGADDIDIIMACACWTVPLLLAEPLIQLRAMRRVRRSVPA
jgi:hypothetical protein